MYALLPLPTTPECQELALSRTIVSTELRVDPKDTILIDNTPENSAVREGPRSRT